jgi:CRISPR system Cascade subunit CasC
MFLELHIIQNFSPSCLNRDDTNAPKDCEFGGWRRARISSQCLKRSFRKHFMEHESDLGLSGALGQRTKLVVNDLVDRLVKAGKKDREQALKVVQAVFEAAEVKVGDDQKTSVLLHLGPDELQGITKQMVGHWAELTAASSGKKEKEKKQVIVDLAKTIREARRSADVALFGRMIAELKELNVDAACQVAHAISTHRVDMEMDFYTAVDDLQTKEDTGAGMMGIQEFSSSCFYSYAVLDFGQLVENLGDDHDLARTAALAFSRAAIEATPTGKQTWSAAHCQPLYVRAAVRDGSAPQSLANAFLAPARRTEAKDDLCLVSIEKLEGHANALNKMYGDGGAKLQRSSIYDGYSDGSVADLLEFLGKALS